MPKGKKNIISKKDISLKKMPTVLISPDNVMFVDRLGNEITRGQLVILPTPSGKTLKIGVFVGLIERTVSTDKYQRLAEA